MYTTPRILSLPLSASVLYAMLSILYGRLLINGVMSKTRDGFLFEQAIRKGGCKRNPKLFEGDYCSLVHQRDGKYKIHMKTIDASTITNSQSFAFSLYCELLNALSIVSL